jgi:hypothetical protein
MVIFHIGTKFSFRKAWGRYVKIGKYSEQPFTLLQGDFF